MTQRKFPSFGRGESSRSRVELTLPPISLLSPTPPVALSDGQPVSPISRKSVQWEDDLGLTELVNALTEDRRYASFMRQTLAALHTDPDTIGWRQYVFSDFLQNREMTNAIRELLPAFANMRHGSAQLGQRRRNLLIETSDRLAELELYLEVVQSLYQAFENAALKSPALTALRDNLQRLMNDPNFQSLRDELPTLRAPLENISSITIGVNLDSQLRPQSAVLLGVNQHQFGEPPSLLDRLIGGRSNEDDESAIASLHHFPVDPDIRPMDALFNDIDRLMTAVAQPIARALGRYVRVTSKPLVALEHELAFYVMSAAMTHRLEAKGVIFSKPEIIPVGERVTHIEGLVNINLALRSTTTPVQSEADFSSNGRIALLTGPNSGGKTTYLRAVGLAHILFQAGLYIPAKSAYISPADQILTHFPALETEQQGRLAEEAERLREVLMRATTYSLVLLNETFSSTSAGEAQYLAQDVLSAMCAIGVRAVFATHLSDLVEKIDQIERAVNAKSNVFSLVAGVRITDENAAAPTYEIRRGSPLGKSYAEEIARRYGISLDQLMANLHGRDKLNL
jgi:DNA mismatch repair protein MutS